MNIKLYITFSFLFAPFFFLCGQTKKDTLSFRVVSYNVENLFDCRHDTDVYKRQGISTGLKPSLTCS